MPGLISGLFQDDDASDSSGSDQSVATDAGTDLALSPSIGLETGGSYQDADGTTHEWSNDTQLGADVDLGASLDTLTSLGSDGQAEG